MVTILTKKNRSILVVFITTLFVIISATQAYAYVRNGPNGKWSAVSATNLTYWKDASVGSYGYGGRVDYGATQWNNVSTKVKLTPVTSGYVDIKIYAGDTGDTSVADALNYKTDFFGNYVACWDCTYEMSRIRINQPVYKNISEKWQYKAPGHEFGHSLGLDHSNTSPAIMLQGDLDYSVTQTDDKNGLKAIYGK